MVYKAPVESYKGKIIEVTIGKDKRAVKIGGENVLAFNQAFDEGAFPNPPKLALEVWDMEPQNWAPWALEPYKDVASDPAAWAKRCEELGADLVYFYLISADPNEKDTSPEKAAELVKRVYEAISIPMIVYTTGNDTKDPAVLAKVAEVLSGENLLLGPVVKDDFEPIANAAKEHGHCILLGDGNQGAGHLGGGGYRLTFAPQPGSGAHNIAKRVQSLLQIVAQGNVFNNRGCRMGG